MNRTAFMVGSMDTEVTMGPFPGEPPDEGQLLPGEQEQPEGVQAAEDESRVLAARPQPI